MAATASARRDWAALPSREVLALLSANAHTARADVLECIGWMRERLAALGTDEEAP